MKRFLLSNVLALILIVGTFSGIIGMGRPPGVAAGFASTLGFVLLFGGLGLGYAVSPVAALIATTLCQDGVPTGPIAIWLVMATLLVFFIKDEWKNGVSEQAGRIVSLSTTGGLYATLVTGDYRPAACVATLLLGVVAGMNFKRTRTNP